MMRRVSSFHWLYVHFLALSSVCCVLSAAIAQTLDADTLRQLAELKAHQSRECLSKGDRVCAVAKALEGLPNNFTVEDIKDRPEAYEALYWAVRSRSIRLPIEGVAHTSFNQDGTRIATVSMNLGTEAREALKLWDGRTGTLIRELLPPESSGNASMTLGPLSFSRDGRLAMHMDAKRGRPIVWDAQTGEVLRELPKIPGDLLTIAKVELSRNGTYGLTTGAHGVILYDIASGKIAWRGKGSMAASISPDEKYIAIAKAMGSRLGQEDEFIRLERFAVGEKTPQFKIDIPEKTWGAYSVVFTDDGERVGITTSTDGLFVVSFADSTFKRISAPRAGLSGISFSADGRYIAARSDDNSTTAPAIFDTASGERVTLPMEQRPALDSVFSMVGEEVGTPWFPQSGDIWRKGVQGAELFEAAQEIIQGIN